MHLRKVPFKKRSNYNVPIGPNIQYNSVYSSFCRLERNRITKFVANVRLFLNSAWTQTLRVNMTTHCRSLPVYIYNSTLTCACFGREFSCDPHGKFKCSSNKIIFCSHCKFLFILFCETSQLLLQTGWTCC